MVSMHPVYIDREPEVVHGRHGEPAVLIRLGGHPDDRWRQVFMDPAFAGGVPFDVEQIDEAVWITVNPEEAARALDWLGARIEHVNEAAEVREHRVVEHALARAVHEWWTTRKLEAASGVR